MTTAKFYRENPNANAWAALDHATNEQKKITPKAVKIKKNAFKGKRALIIGSGVAGLTTAYELLAQESGMEVTILEALNRTGGRCLTLRTGDTLTEDADSQLFDSQPGETQTVRFKHPVGDNEPYLNAGPGRIPSAHKRLLSYLKKFGVDIEVYVMNSEANLVQMKGGPDGNKAVAYRQIDHSTRGWIAQLVYEKAEYLLEDCDVKITKSKLSGRVQQLKDLMITFGQLDSTTGKYQPTAGEDGLENGRSRAGFEILPGVAAGTVGKPFSFEALLKSAYWDKTRFYQPSDFLWQATLFQPVGGMDRVQHSFAQQVAALGGTLHLNSPVRSIEWDSRAQEFVVCVEQIGTTRCREYRADYLFSNLAMPFLKKILARDLQDSKKKSGLQPDFKKGLQAVYQAQFSPPEPDADGFSARFLANTTKVGWQGDRTLWQGSNIGSSADTNESVDPKSQLNIPGSEEGVVPIFGGISWTDDEIAQIWYPSNDFHDQKGILTGAYNFSEFAFKWGRLEPDDRLKLARKGARKFGKEFGDGLECGVAIAWQNMPHIKGGWAQWHTVKDPVPHFNALAQGSGICDGRGKPGDPAFFIVGDQVSSLPGWQEGAIASALNALKRLSHPEMEVAYLSQLPDTRLMVEGI
ncbi:FAD-dependent oxidoreductase [Verrucomicrobiaceae bacterium 227]